MPKLFLLGLVLLMALIASSVVAQGPPAGLNVNVINPPSHPVPVTLQGTGSIAGTVNAVQSGTWNVGITGTPGVRNLDEPGRAPYASHTQFGTTTTSCFALGGGFQSCTLSGFTPVPAGKRLVIKDVSGHIREPAGCKPAFVSIDGITQVQVLPRPNLAIPDVFDFRESVLNFVDAGAAPTVTIDSSCAGLDGDQQTVAIVGYLVDVP